MKNMYFDKLKKLLIPPDNIDDMAIEKNIELVEKHYKLKFPQDYIQFITTYGSGQINEFINIYSTINSAAYYEMIESECRYYRDFKEKFPEKYTYNAFPKQNRLFPLGRTDGGCLMWWHMAIEPENWTIVIYDENSWENEKFDMQLCEFIYKYFTRKIRCKGFPDSLLENDRPCFNSNEFNFKMYCDSFVQII